MGVVSSKNFSTSNVVSYVDSDFTGDLDKRRFLTSYLFTLTLERYSTAYHRFVYYRRRVHDSEESNLIRASSI